MAGDKITAEDIFKDNDPFETANTGGQKLIETLQQLIVKLHEVSEEGKKAGNNVQLNNSGDAKKLISYTNNLNGNSDAALNAEIKIVKLTEAKRKAQEAYYRDLRKNSLQADRDAKAEAKAVEILNSKYKQATRALADVKTQLKELEITGRTNGKLYKALTEEFEQLDKKVRGAEYSVGEFQRNVGNYSETIIGAAEATELMGTKTGLFIRKLGGLQRGLEETKGAFKEIGAAGAVGIGLLITGIVAVGKYLEDMSERSSQAKAELAGLKAEAELTGQRFTGLGESILEVLKGAVGMQASTDIMSQGWSKFTGKMDAGMKAVRQAAIEMSILDDKLKQITRDLELQNAQYNTQKSIAEQIASDETVNFSKREAALKKSNEYNDLVLENELTIAEKKQEIAERRLDYEQKLGKSGLQLETAKNELSEANIAVEVANRNIQVDALEDAQKLRKLKEDELALDIELLRSRRKSSTEQHDLLVRDADDERKQYEDRKTAAYSLLSLNKRVFDEQIDKFKKSTGAQFDADKLLADGSSISLQRKLKNMGLDVKQTEILSEVIKKTQDAQLEGQGKINKVEEDYLKVLNKIRETVAETAIEQLQHDQKLQESETEKKIKAFEESNTGILDATKRHGTDIKKIRDNQYNSAYDSIGDMRDTEEETIAAKAKEEEIKANDTIVNTEELNAKIVEIEQKKENDLYDINEKYFEKLEELQKKKVQTDQELRKKEIEETAKQVNEDLQILSTQVSKRAELNEQALDVQIDQTKSNLDEQAQLASRGRSNIYAFEKAELAKEELEKVQEAKRQARIQEGLAFLKLYASFAEKDPDTAFQKAAEGIAAAEIFSQGFFYKGTENVAEALGKPMFKGRDGYGIRVDGDERIMTGEQNKMLGDISNKELAELGRSYNEGMLPRYIADDISGIDVGESVRSGALINEMRGVKKELSELHSALKARPVQQVDVDGLGNLIDRRFENNLEKITRYLSKYRDKRL